MIFFSTTGRRGRRRFSPRPLEEGQGEGGFGVGRRTLRMPFLAWLQRRVGLEPTPMIFFSTTRCRDRRRFYPRPWGEGQGEGKFGAGRRHLRMPFRAWSQKRVGLKPTPTIFFSTTGRRGR